MKDGFISVACGAPKLRLADCAYNAEQSFQMMRSAEKAGVKVLVLKLVVIGQMGLGNHAQNPPFLYYNGAIIQFVMDSQGHSHRRHYFQVPRGLQHGFQSLLRLPQEGLLIEEIAAGVARHPQLRQDQDLKDLSPIYDQASACGRVSNLIKGLLAADIFASR